jgi:hypothetical protein
MHAARDWHGLDRAIAAPDRRSACKLDRPPAIVRRLTRAGYGKENHVNLMRYLRALSKKFVPGRFIEP